MPHRRGLLATLLATGLAGAASSALAAPGRKTATEGPATALGTLVPDAPYDQTVALQTALEQAAIKGAPLLLGPGRYRIGTLNLIPGAHLAGSARTVIEIAATGAGLKGDGAHGVRLERLRIETPAAPREAAARSGRIELRGSRDIVLEDVTIVGGPAHGIALDACSGRVASCRVMGVGAAGIFSIDAKGIEIVGNTVSDCLDNGILVWRSTAGEDGTLVAQNRIERIGAASGGSGQYGNGVNVFRAGAVRVTANRIVDCTYSAVRGNAASNIQIVANSVERIGEVALYAEFGFEGALIAQNIVDGAATGISVTNFNEGGRLAVIQGNLVRNLRRRELEPVDKRGEGIAVEADASVTGNTIEGAPTAGIVIGWGRHMRDVAATGNVVRGSRIGIMITRDPAAGTCLVAQNLISGAQDGAIRLMELGRAVGEDLARAPSRSDRIVVTGNTVPGSAS